jgi:hypothetical protein
MKKTLLIVAIAGLAMASCKKDRTCTCTTTWTPTSGAAVVSSEEITVKKAKKGAALDGECRSYSYQTTAPVAGSKTDVACELK